jgi:signal transduction histidine kinase
MDRALLSFPTEHEEPAFQTLESIDRAQRTVHGAPCPDALDWNDLMSGATTLAVALAGNARRDGDRSRFERALNLLPGEHPEVKNAIIYEECLWDLASGRLNELVAKLDNWLPAPGEATWSLRKAGLLAEMEDHPRACALLETTLAHIRRTRRRDIDDLVSLSLEGWALFLALAYSNDVLEDSPSLPQDIPEPFDRWRALGIVDCNAFSEFNSIRRLLEAEDTSNRPITKTRGFDLDHHGVTHHFGGPSSTLLAAYQVVQLAEATGIPPSARRMALLQDGLKSAARILAKREPWLACQLTIRMAADNSLVDDVFSRANVARLPTLAVALAAECLRSRISFALDRAGPRPGDKWDGLSMAANAIELLSRIAVRLDDEKLLELFDLAIGYYSSPTFRQYSVLFGRPISHLISRILESISPPHVGGLIFKLFSLPLPNEVGPARDEYRWQDPARLLPRWLRNFGTTGQGEAWSSTIARLIAGVRSTNHVDRNAAVARLHKLHEWKILTAEQCREFAAALWASNQLDETGLPAHTGLLRWVLLILPEVSPGQAADALRQFVATQGKKGALSQLTEIAEIVRHLKRLGLSAELPNEVQSDLKTAIGTWADSRRPARNSLDLAFNRRAEQEKDMAEAVRELLPFVNVDTELAERVWSKATAMDERQDGAVPAFHIYPFLVARFPNRVDILIDRVLRALLASDEETARAAVQGLFFLLQSPIEPETLVDRLGNLVREVGLAIAARRLVLLRPALDLARWLFEAGPEPLRQIITHECDNGLKALFEEAAYSRYDQTFYVPAIRSACILLADAMNQSGLGELAGVKIWLQASANDPLPEVRNASGRKYRSE